MDWRVKAMVQKVLGVLPGGDAMHYHLQRRFGGLRDFRGELATKVDDWAIMVGHLRDAGLPIPGARLMEIGTGWYPTFPFACYLGGAQRVVTFDLTRHLRPALVRGCAQGLGEFVDRIASACHVDAQDVRERHRHLVATLAQSIDLAAATRGVVEYHAPADATRTGLPDASLDAVFSNSVLEHVPPAVIADMYRESMRVLAPGALMFHSVNCGDHYAYVDRRIGQLHYLQYSDRQWRLWTNAFLYQNRMRAHEFVDGARAAGFEIILDTATARPHRLEELSRLKVDARFADVPPEKLAITSVDFIGRTPLR